MNLERMKKLRDAVKRDLFLSQDVGFNMTFYISTDINQDDHYRIPDYTGHNCGTVCCLAGYTALLSGMKLQEIKDMVYIAKVAQKYLQIDLNEGANLFAPVQLLSSENLLTKELALKVLDICIAEKRVPEEVWKRVLEEEKSDA